MTRFIGVVFMAGGAWSYEPSHIALFCCGAFLIGCCKVADAIREGKS